MAKIDGIQLPADLGNSLGGTHEEAAKVFLSAASKGLAKVMADAVAKAMAEAVGTLGDGESADWVKLIKGGVATLDWETPPNTLPQRVVTFSEMVTDNALGGVTFSGGFTVTGTF